MKCEGLACNAVEILWDALVCAYRIKNCSERSVLITLTSSSGNISVHLGPRADTIVEIAQIDLPYNASFL